MESRAKVLGHPVHQMLIVFPLGLLATAVLFDIGWLMLDRSDLTVVSWWLMVAGVVGGLVAAPFGTVDWLAIPHGTRARRVGALHGAGNALVVVMFALSAWLRGRGTLEPGAGALALSFGGAALSLATAWLGGELVSRLGVGVSDGAGLDAPSALKGPVPATAARRQKA
ncbi:MAG: DUF2231 domain-containing protein [Aquincola tertiaricarbonis]